MHSSHTKSTANNPNETQKKGLGYFGLGVAFFGFSGFQKSGGFSRGLMRFLRRFYEVFSSKSPDKARCESAHTCSNRCFSGKKTQNNPSLFFGKPKKSLSYSSSKVLDNTIVSSNTLSEEGEKGGDKGNLKTWKIGGRSYQAINRKNALRKHERFVEDELLRKVHGVDTNFNL